jgi:drug/metabolite transporter (DMT)-like permease
LLGAVLLGEKLSPLAATGAVLILAEVYIGALAPAAPARRFVAETTTDQA